VTFGWLRYPHGLGGKPRDHLAPTLLHGQRSRKYPWIRPEPYERKKGCPWQPHRSYACKLKIKPLSSSRVLGSGVIGSVNKNVNVNQDHLKSSPSA
jgi:hypothetical protein